MYNKGHTGLQADSHTAEPNGSVNTQVKEAAEKEGVRQSGPL